MELQGVAFASLTTESFVKSNHPEMTEAIGNFCQWLSLSRFEPLTDALWMRTERLNSDEEHEIRKLAIDVLMATRASGIDSKTFFFNAWMDEGELAEVTWRKQSYDLVDAGI